MATPFFCLSRDYRRPEFFFQHIPNVWLDLGKSTEKDMRYLVMVFLVALAFSYILKDYFWVRDVSFGRKKFGHHASVVRGFIQGQLQEWTEHSH